jgi:hypothetical protein
MHQAAVSDGRLRALFDLYRANRVRRFQIHVRRVRAEQIWRLLSNPDAVTRDLFKKEIGDLKSATYLCGQSSKGYYSVPRSVPSRPASSPRNMRLASLSSTATTYEDQLRLPAVPHPPLRSRGYIACLVAQRAECRAVTR